MFGLGKLTKKLFGSANDRYLSKLQPRIDAINALEAEMEALSDEALQSKTQEFRDRLEEGATLDSLLVEAFAVVREASKRTLGLRHYDVQLVGGMVLHDNSIAEMKTGEGKTLVATLAAYLNALPGKGVHVVTVNDYLARRDAEWMSQIYSFLGLTTGIIIPGIPDEMRREAYFSDITYATNNELGFDYLRDNSSKHHTRDMVQRDFHFAIVDEVDSILVDEARTPLIISGPAEDKSDQYVAIDAIVAELTEDHFEKDEKSKNVSLTEEGTEFVEGILKDRGLLKSDDLYDYENTSVVHHVDQALKARTMFERDKDYIVKGGKVIIIDEFTGRMMEGRRFSGGLHQALEAKEDVTIQPENQTLASITFQNFFRMYPKLSGMTGTAATEAEEFQAIYGLGVVEIPTNVPVAREDADDEFYRTAGEKYASIIADIKESQDKGQPILVGTVSIEKSEVLSGLLKKAKIKHQVLNARYHEQEAQIVAQAGRLGAVTIATNMAGRGTDIQLGGNYEMRLAEETEGLDDGIAKDQIGAKIKAEIDAEKAKVLEAGGLYVMATERHESRRIDNQLRGRSGRQGDPGKSKFYLSLEDDLMRIFGPERMNAVLVKLGIEEGEAIVHPWINKAIERAQTKVEARNYDIRKQVVKYDDVMNDQRKVIYEQRREIMDADDVAETVRDMRHEVVSSVVAHRIPPKAYADSWDLDGLEDDTQRLLGLDVPVRDWANEEGVDGEGVEERLMDAADKHMALKATKYGIELWRNVEKSILLQVVDNEWKEHLSNLDHLRQGVGLRAFAQRDPLNEYKTEAFTLFEGMLHHSREQLTSLLSRIEIQAQTNPDDFLPEQPGNVVESHVDPVTGENEMKRGAAGEIDPNDPSTWGNVSRNAPCPCGSGKKYKHCHGAMDNRAALIAATKAGNQKSAVTKRNTKGQVSEKS